MYGVVFSRYGEQTSVYLSDVQQLVVLHLPVDVHVPDPVRLELQSTRVDGSLKQPARVDILELSTQTVMVCV